MARLKRHIQILAVGLLTLFATYYTIVALYAHIHVVNGVMLVHSHPFNKPHNHSNGQTLSLHFLSSPHMLEAESGICITPFHPILWQVIGIPDFSWDVFDNATNIYLRAPPQNYPFFS